MTLPVNPPVSPMLARAAASLPEGDRWRYEPKWDGFRCVVFRDGADVVLGSRNERPLTRYFPEVVETVRANLPERCVLDGEVVVATAGGLDFDALSTRIHPAESRVRMLAGSTPASFVAFDCLALGDRDLRPAPFVERREALVEALGSARPPVHLTPLTATRSVAEEWFERFEGAGLDGVVAKPVDGPYEEGRRVMVKVKHERTADFVVAGLRWYKDAPGRAVGSLLLGLYHGDELRHVGVIGSFPAERRRSLVEELAPWRDPEDHPWAAWAGADSAGPRGAVSRWNAGKDLGFVPLDPTLVVEAAFEHLQGHRLRHTARFRRFRPDRDARSCTFEQVDVAVPSLLADVFGADVR